MAKHLLKFNTAAEYGAATINKPAVSWVVEDNEVKYDPYIPPIDYTKEYLSFVAEESGTFKFSGNTISYSLNNGDTWVSLASDTNTPTISAGAKIMWKSTLSPANGVGIFSSTGRFSVEGNIMSLIYGNNFVNQTSLPKDNIFQNLFSGSTGLTSAENLVLPATTLKSQCYLGMFRGCTSLTTAPVLPATTMVGPCYKQMFNGCTSLTTAPELPATTLANNCYDSMFGGCTSLTTAPSLSANILKDHCYREMFRSCTSLTTAPELRATTLTSFCYYCMFYGCSNLNSVTCLATDISASYCTSYWVQNVASSGTFTKASNMSNWTSGISGIPNGWTVVNA